MFSSFLYSTEGLMHLRKKFKYPKKDNIYITHIPTETKIPQQTTRTEIQNLHNAQKAKAPSGKAGFNSDDKKEEYRDVQAGCQEQITFLITHFLARS